MDSYIEPVYLNEKMVLNCAAYLFKGVAMESEAQEGKKSAGKGNISLGFKFLSDLISPLSGSAELAKESTSSTKTARRYTMGGLHMTLIDELNDRKLINRKFNVTESAYNSSFVELDVILKPVDFYSILEALKISAPLICQVLQNFGEKINQKVFGNKKLKEDIKKYEELIANVLSELESDYLKSGQLEMLMSCPSTGRQIGVLDVDVGDADALSVKAKLTDGRFRVIGRVSRQIEEGETISLVQRTVLSSILSIVEKVVGVTNGIQEYQASMNVARGVAQQVCQLNLSGPAVRVMAMSVCI
ncbi:hypothetical protein QN412_22620 [Pseudomonas sp. RTB3]|uniref:DUF6414 family protein n=1 Tax=unclassified Pseudomonas TaxID=196821 RepID=UPI002B231595|nr:MULTISPECIES: hypothetical protein [unclassified Pseudomonas]MEB0009127.1 hypothetical protein [Pseudomonas sp. RTB2]MEB0019722.1 hypothetical protein [Pseudomonas sp. RTB3]MEB0272197.1 hypothetical protein [Pseudomonas sp. 5B4]